MRTYPDAVETLDDPEVRKYFLALLGSDIPVEEKYQTFIRFFKIESDLSQRLQAQSGLAGGDAKAMGDAVAAAAKDAGAWQPESILEQTRDGLHRALRRIRRSRHRDGGWGYKYEESHAWATAWTVLCLHRASELGFERDAVAIDSGLLWLRENRSHWSLDPGDIPPGGTSAYEAALVLRCLLTTGAAEAEDVGGYVERSIAGLLEKQYPEGDWGPTLRGGDRTGERSSPEDVGATSLALQALAASGRRERAVAEAAARAVEWLGREQNPDGGWNASAYPPHTPVPVPSVNKTCDALKGLLAGGQLGIDLEPYRPGMDKAVRWVLQQEQADYEEGRITGWAWKSEESRDEDGKAAEHNLLENTCLTLETLLDVEAASLPQLAANTLWLLGKQVRRDDAADDGKWSNDDTGRIASALLEFYCRIRESPIFRPTAAVPAGTAKAAAE